MQHHRPHPTAKFEGFYSKFELPSGASLILILCTVTKARSHNVTITYVPARGPIYQTELWTSDFSMINTANGFTLTASDAEQDINAKMIVTPNSTTYSVRYKSTLTFTASTTSRKPWSSNAMSLFNTPAHLLAVLPLPLHWHVHSLASPGTFTLALPAEANLPETDTSGSTVVHEEKNWANGFPSAHIWVQAREASTSSSASSSNQSSSNSNSNSSSICLAGGQTIGVEAFLLGYRNVRQNIEWNFRPPVAMTLPFLRWSPFMAYAVDWSLRRFTLSVEDWWQGRRITVNATAPKGSFFTLSSPHPGGFEKHAMAESMEASVAVECWRRSWWNVVGRWEWVCEERFERGALEFGGEYYPGRGAEEKEE